MPARLAQQENENGLMEAPCPHGALSSKERDEDIPPPLIFNDIQRFSREIDPWIINLCGPLPLLP
jgi:hypothetical protein